jgi:GTP cyclohydrolase I
MLAMSLITGGFHMHQQSNPREILAFPAEHAASEAVTTILRFIGEDPSRDGLIDTPARVLKAWREMTSGYADDPAEILARTFEESSDEMVVLRGISFHSTCEHHMLPFYGEASVGYLPGKVVGISKLARLVDCFARRLQIQERLTRQIAESVEEHLEARGVGVIIRAHHLCMGCRGVRQQTTEMVTSAMLGTLRSDAMARAEFLRLTE